MRILNLTAPNKIERRTVIRELRILMITHHFLQGVDTVDELAAIAGVSAKKVVKWTETKTWHSALEFWGGRHRSQALPRQRRKRVYGGTAHPPETRRSLLDSLDRDRCRY